MLNKPLSSIYFTAFDFETTGLYPDRDKIIEIGAVKFNLQGDEFRFSGLIDPGVMIPAEASAVNGINNEMVKGKPGISEILPGFLSFISGTVLVAHNIGFDANFLVQAVNTSGLDTEDLICLDTVLLARRYFKGAYSYSLENITRHLGIKIENAHRAEDDAAACMKLFIECIKNVPDYKYAELKTLLKHSGLRKKSLIQNYTTGR